jgi:autotransporter-associated beta strand protein
MCKKNKVSVCAAAVAATLVASHLSAADLQWRGGTGAIDSANYTTNGTDSVAPVSGDWINIGAGGTVTNTTNYSIPGRMRVGHNFPYTPGFGGDGTVNLNSGSISLGGNGGAGFAGLRAGLVIGYNANGTFNLNGGIVNVTENVILGCDDPTDDITGTGVGTLNILSGTFRDRRNDMLIGFGLPGVVNLTAGGNMEVFSSNVLHTETPDLYVGYTTASTFSKTGGGDLFVANAFYIGSGSSVTLAAGNIDTKHEANATTANLVVGRNGSANDVLNISWNGVPSKTGGPTSVAIGNRFLLASGGGGATNATVNQSGGNVTAALNLVVSDTGNASSAVYNLSGSGTLVANGELSRVGRRGDGKMFQTGGTATFNAGLAVGDDDSTAAGETDNATGLYEISAGSLITNLAGGNALSVGSAGNGTLRVVGQDGVVDVNGDMLVGNTSDGAGNLAYRFEGTETLSVVDVSGTATFAKGSGLSLDSSLASPTGRFYDVLTAAGIVDNGLVLSPGWAHTIINGGTQGKLLQVGQVETRYWDTNGNTPGSGGATPTGTWDGTTANFTSDVTGASATVATTIYADDVSFGGIADATGTYTVNVSGTQTAHAVKVAQGNVTLAGGTIAAPIFDVAAGATATVASNLAGGVASSVTKTGAGVMTLTSAGTYTGGTNVAGGTFVLGAGGSLADTGAVDVTGGTLDINSANETVGAVTLASGAITGTTGVLTGSSYAVQSGSISAKLGGAGALTKTTAGTVTLSAANTYAGGTNVNGGTLVLAHADATAGGSINVADGAVAQAQAGLSKAVTVSTLNTNASGKFDVTDNSMVVKGMADSAVRTQLAAGYNGGAWNGATGIVSTSITSATSLGYATQAQTGATDFKGVTGLTGTDVLVKYTYAGDANLDGKVDIGDLGLLAGAWQQLSGKVWFDGDFTYDGAVDIGDLGLLAGNWQKGVSSGQLLVSFDEAMAQFTAFDGVVVPEPGTIGLLGGAVILGLTRRRRASRYRPTFGGR